MQHLIVSLLVPLCGVYVLWSLMPTAARRALARRLLGLPGLQRVGALQRAARSGGGGCHCSEGGGCAASAPGAQAGATQPVRIVRGAAPRPPQSRP